MTIQEKARRVQQSVRARRINDAAHALGVSRTTLYNMAAAEKLRLVKVGGRTLVPETEIDRLVEGAQ